MNVRVHKDYWGFNTKEIERLKNAKYIGDFPTKNGEDSYFSTPVAVFYQENPKEGHSNYFGLHRGLFSKEVYIMNASSAVEEPFQAVETDEGDLLISCFPHDYYESDDGRYMIDGGRSGYIRTNKDNKLVQVKIENGEFKKI